MVWHLPDTLCAHWLDQCMQTGGRGGRFLLQPAVSCCVEDQGDGDRARLQEVTPYIHNLLQQCSWWGKYGGGGCPPNTGTCMKARTRIEACTK